MAKEVMRRLLEGNERYGPTVEIWDDLQQGQSPKITLVTCSDSRVSGHILDEDMINHVFHIRNIGNQIENNFGSVDYGVHHLKTPILLIMGHTDCGAVKASQTDFTDETDGIKKELYPLYFNLSEAAREDGAHRITKLVQANVDKQVTEALKKYSQVFIVGAVFDMHAHYSNNPGRIIITNINGITDEDEIREHPLLSSVEKSLKEVRVARL